MSPTKELRLVGESKQLKQTTPPSSKYATKSREGGNSANKTVLRNNFFKENNPPVKGKKVVKQVRKFL